MRTCICHAKTNEQVTSTVIPLKAQDLQKGWIYLNIGEIRVTNTKENQIFCIEAINNLLSASANICSSLGLLACFGPWGRKESDTTERLTELNWLQIQIPEIAQNKGVNIMQYTVFVAITAVYWEILTYI